MDLFRLLLEYIVVHVRKAKVNKLGNCDKTIEIRFYGFVGGERRDSLFVLLLSKP